MSWASRAKSASPELPFAKPMTLADFLAWEERQPLRYEFDGFDPVAMTGGTAGRADIQRNLAAIFAARPRGGPCRFHGSDLKFRTAQDRVRYPDGMIVCTPVDRKATIVHDPVVVFEVLSPSTDRIDRLQKGAGISSDALRAALSNAGAG